MNTIFRQIKFFVLALLIIGGVLVLTFSNSPVAVAEDITPPPPLPPSKNQAELDDFGQATTISGSYVRVADQANLNAYQPLMACRDSDDVWDTSSDNWDDVLDCDLTVPQDGKVLIIADTWVNYRNGFFEAKFALDIDSKSGDADTERWVLINEIEEDEWDEEAVRLSAIKPVSMGTHTFYFLANRDSGTGRMRLRDSNLSVIFIPNENTDLLTCGVTEKDIFSTRSGDYKIIHECELTVPQDGMVFIAADGSARWKNGSYEANFRLRIDDDEDGYSGSDRWVNVDGDTETVSGSSVIVSMLRSISAGAHTFYFIGRHVEGDGRVDLYNPSLSVVYIPNSSPSALACGESANDDWKTRSDDFDDIVDCTISSPAPGWALIVADGSLALEESDDDGYTADFRLDVDSENGDGDTDRRINVLGNDDDGTDKNVGVSKLKLIPPGEHDYNFLGERESGPSRVVVDDPTVSVIFLMPKTWSYLPFLIGNP